MAEEISVRFTNAKKEYVQTLTPLAFTNDIKSTLKVTCDVSTIDYDWVKDNVLNNLETIYMQGGLQTLVLWFFDEYDKDFCQVTLIHDPRGDVLGSHAFDPTVTLSDPMKRAANIILSNLMLEIADIALRCKSSTTTISSAMSSMASAVGATPPSPAPGSPAASAAELDKLCNYIRDNTKAEVVKPTETLSDYICNNLLKEELEEIKDFFANAGVYKAANVAIPKGILFKGPPGTGKTYAARCIAGSVDCYFMICTASALQGMYIGSGAENIRAVFKGARLLSEKSGKGVILFIDEIDSFGDRQHRGGSSSGEEDRTLNQLLAEMSGFTPDDNVMVLAATNFSERLDNALLRSGRFGRQITIDYPDDYERKHIIEYYFSKITLPLEKSTSYDEISDLAKGLTPADLKEIANESGILTIRSGAADITLSNINEAINKVITKNIKHPDKSKEELDIVTAHECGHVLAEVIYNNTIPIKVTNYAYGDAGGFTQSAEILAGILPKDRFLTELKMLLGGRAAEEVICGFVTNGASNDLERAKKLLTSYYKLYNFETYQIKELDQIVLDKLNSIYKEVCKDFKDPVKKDVLTKLITALNASRVLYNKDLSGLVSSLRKVVF